MPWIKFLTKLDPKFKPNLTKHKSCSTSTTWCLSSGQISWVASMAVSVSLEATTSLVICRSKLKRLRRTVQILRKIRLSSSNCKDKWAKTTFSGSLRKPSARPLAQLKVIACLRAWCTRVPHKINLAWLAHTSAKKGPSKGSCIQAVQSSPSQQSRASRHRVRKEANFSCQLWVGNRLQTSI